VAEIGRDGLLADLYEAFAAEYLSGNEGESGRLNYVTVGFHLD
jgi:hypothetical protein